MFSKLRCFKICAIGAFIFSDSGGNIAEKNLFFFIFIFFNCRGMLNCNGGKKTKKPKTILSILNTKSFCSAKLNELCGSLQGPEGKCWRHYSRFMKCHSIS